MFSDRFRIGLIVKIALNQLRNQKEINYKPSTANMNSSVIQKHSLHLSFQQEIFARLEKLLGQTIPINKIIKIIRFEQALIRLYQKYHPETASNINDPDFKNEIYEAIFFFFLLRSESQPVDLRKLHFELLVILDPDYKILTQEI